MVGVLVRVGVSVVVNVEEPEGVAVQLRVTSGVEVGIDVEVAV